jgi:pyruvate dehydrogenase E2 component (dihydrolipoamide acetyltransferase)
LTTSSLLGVGRIADRPVVRDGRIEVRPMLNLMISIDHRQLDGLVAYRLLRDVCRALESPDKLLDEQDRALLTSSGRALTQGRMDGQP